MKVVNQAFRLAGERERELYLSKDNHLQLFVVQLWQLYRMPVNYFIAVWHRTAPFMFSQP